MPAFGSPNAGIDTGFPFASTIAGIAFTGAGSVESVDVDVLASTGVPISYASAYPSMPSVRPVDTNNAVFQVRCLLTKRRAASMWVFV